MAGRHAFNDGTIEWAKSMHYGVGAHVVWRGVLLVCCRGHEAGAMAEHPWDPEDGTKPSKQADLWSPAGHEQSKLLLSLPDLPEAASRSTMVGEAGREAQRERRRG